LKNGDDRVMSRLIQKAVTDRGKKIMEYLESFLPEDQDWGHALSHLIRVHRIGIRIGKEEGTNLKILEPALLLHDIKSPKTQRIAHAKLSADFARNILPTFGYNRTEVDEIVSAILYHSRSLKKDEGQAVTLEAKVVYDADKCDGVGADGIERVQKMWTDNIKEGARWYLERILDVVVKEPLYTKIGKQIANKRIKRSLSWCKKELKDEYFEILKKHGFNSEKEVKV